MSQPPFPQQPNPQFQQVPGQPTPPQQPVKPKKKWYQRVWVWILVAIVFIVIAANGNKGGTSTSTSTSGNSTSQTSTSTSGNSTSQTSSSAAEEPAVKVSVDELESTLKNNPLKAQQTYKSKRVEVTGLVTNIDAQGKYFSLGPQSGEFTLTGVQVYITPDMQSKVASLSKDEKVTVIGTMTDVGEILGYSLRATQVK